MRLKIIVFFIIIFQLFVTQSLHAATLQGRILCEDGRTYPETVTIEIPIQGGPLKITSDRYSHYSVTIQPGRYIFIIKEQSFDVFVYPQNAPRDFYLPCK